MLILSNGLTVGQKSVPDFDVGLQMLFASQIFQRTQ